MKNPKTNLIVIAGMPGAGKSFYSKDLEAQGITVFDDFYSNARDNKREIENSRYYKDFCNKLDKGENCAITDIVFCIKPEQSKLRRFVKDRWGNNIKIEWRIFENKPRKCWSNASKRGREKEHKDREKENIGKLTKAYHIPHGAKILKVF